MRLRYNGKLFQIRAHTQEERSALSKMKHVTYNKEEDWFETKLFRIAKEFIESSHDYRTRSTLESFSEKWDFSWATAPSKGFSVPSNEGLQYLDYQLAGIEYMMRNPGVLLADEPGTGKTIQIAGYLNSLPEIKRALIICPSSLRLNWNWINGLSINPVK